uniref:Uncharacterized protein n=1 Tax=Arundo donax TaxID=35708 RepID=A0A0A8YUP9_ARUDO
MLIQIVLGVSLKKKSTGYSRTRLDQTNAHTDFVMPCSIQPTVTIYKFTKQDEKLRR